MKLFKKKETAQEPDIVASDNGEEIDAEAIMRKYDKESNTRIWEGIPKAVITGVMVLFSVYCLYMTLFSLEQAETRLARFVGCIIIIGYLMYPAKKTEHKVNHIPWYDLVLMVAGAASFFYFSFNTVDILMMGTRIGTLEVVLGIIGILVLVELCRRCVGIPIIIVVACLLVYALIWQFNYNGDLWRTLSNVVQKLFYTTSGVIGTPTNVCYTYIVLFIIFGAFLERTGIANFFISFANRIAGWSSGGPAKVAVISSALCGMVSGSSVGNTVTTGSVTIPMMKKTGYRPEFAGAVEAASSTGGQIMPPIMGAAAFLMAEYMGIPYIQVATIAIIPAILYFVGIFWTVHLEAKKQGLKGIPFNELPTWIYLLKNCYLIIPLVLLVWIVSAGIYTMAVSAAISIFAALVIGFIHFFLTNWEERTEEDTLGSILLETCRSALFSCIDAFAAGARNSISVGVACALAGLIAGCITFTGLASTIINVIVMASGDFLFIGLFLTMLCCIVLGMGVPTTANYCIMAATCAPILIQLGVPLICAHFFVFYFGILADITPPVALAAYAGSAIAKSKPMRTAVNASRLGIAAYITPYVFAFFPAMIMQGETPLPIFLVVLNVVLAMCGLFGVAAGLQGYLFHKINWVLRIIVVAAGVLIMIPISSANEMYSILINVGGFAIIAAITLIQRQLGKKHAAQLADGTANTDAKDVEGASEADTKKLND
ncbi:MAG: TRAP transporter permease [Eggerthellaceae bacterium]